MRHKLMGNLQLKPLVTTHVNCNNLISSGREGPMPPAGTPRAPQADEGGGSFRRCEGVRARRVRVSAVVEIMFIEKRMFIEKTNSSRSLFRVTPSPFRR